MKIAVSPVNGLTTPSAPAAVSSTHEPGSTRGSSITWKPAMPPISSRIVGARARHAARSPGLTRATSDERSAARRIAPDPSLDPTRPARVSGGLPWRFLWYRFEILEAYLRVGRNADVLRLTAGVLRDAPDHEEAHSWRGRALAALGRTAQARAELQTALRLRPGFAAARVALSRPGMGRLGMDRLGN